VPVIARPGGSQLETYSLRTNNIKRRRTWDIILGCSYALLFALILLGNHIKDMDCGSAFGGKIESRKFIVISDKGNFQSVGASEWILNLGLTLLVMVVAPVAMRGLIYFPLRYYFIPLMKAKQKRNLS
jgi:hypothetical protein